MTIRGNTVGTPMPRTDWNQTDPNKADYLKGRNDLVKSIQDAQAAAIAVSAPTGYGLGEKYCKRVNSVEEITESGYYILGLDQTSGDPAHGNYIFHAVVDATYNNVHLQSKMNGGYIHRDKWNGVWGEWEWVNPPMALGMEYRTTERWMGEPVYAKVLNIGVLPNASASEISHGINATHIVRCDGVTNYGNALPFVADSNAIYLGCDKVKIYVTTTADYSYAQAYVTIYYTKT